MPAFVSSARMTSGGVPPPVHCKKPRDLNTLTIASSSSLPPQAATMLTTNNVSKYLHISPHSPLHRNLTIKYTDRHIPISIFPMTAGIFLPFKELVKNFKPR